MSLEANNTVLSKAYSDICNIKIDRDEKLSDIMDHFYDVMRKHGIRQGTPSFNSDGEQDGVTMSTSEWSMMYQAFKSTTFEHFFVFEPMLHTPEDLQCYDGTIEDFQNQGNLDEY